MDTQFDCSLFSASEASQALAFAIEYHDPARLAQTPDKGNYMNSIVVRIEPQDVLFILSATEPEMATRSFAEALARRTALSAIEKDIPAGVELALSARQLDQIPPRSKIGYRIFIWTGIERGWSEPVKAHKRRQSTVVVLRRSSYFGVFLTLTDHVIGKRSFGRFFQGLAGFSRSKSVVYAAYLDIYFSKNLQN